MQIIQTVFAAGGAVAGSLLAALYIFQEKLLYHPSIPTREYEKHPGDFGLNYVDVDIVTDDNVKLHGWLITTNSPKRSPTFIYFHGNAGNISHRLPDVRFFIASGFNVLMVSYRGYGKSEGAPYERGLRLDAIAALRYARDRSDVIDQSRIYIFGRSIGGACAIALAAAQSADQAVRGLVVENTFTSIDDMIDCVLPILKFVKILNRNKWDSTASISSIQVPILFISGLRDELVPPQHMIELRKCASKARFTEFYEVEGGGHNDTWWVGGREYRDAMHNFLQRVESQ